MTTKILINAIDPEECRIAKVKNSKLEAFHIERGSRELTHGNIYKAAIVRIEPSLQAVFVDYGAERHGFLQKHEIHYDYFLEEDSGNRPIQNLVRRQQELLVQIVKEPYRNKGAMLTTLISLPGRYMVLMPGSEVHGISRKIEDEKERTRLKEILSKLDVPENCGVIIRTAGAGANKTQISRDLRYLVRLWKNIKDNVMREKTPALLYKEKSLAQRAIRDSLTPEDTQILIDNEEVYQSVKDFVKIISPKHTRIVNLYKGAKPLFTKFELERQISSIFENRVALKSGGSIVIEPTEALVAIDVNSGKATQKTSVEATALQTNLEAAEEVARQLRLRDLGGLIVVDFIDMREKKHKSAVEKALKDHLKIDKARTRVGNISRFGLIEMSRQRVRPSIESSSFETCRRCGGKGLTPTAETLGLGFLRQLNLESLKEGISVVRGIVPLEVADYLLNRKRRDILDLEDRRGLSIVIEGDRNLPLGESRIDCEATPQSGRD
jgi:ribonuclease E